MREKYGYGDNCGRNRESKRTGAYRSRKRSLPSPNPSNKGDTTYGLADVYRSVVPARPWGLASGLDVLAGRVVAMPGRWLANTRTWWWGAALRLNFEVGDSNDGEELAGRKTEKPCRNFRRETVPGADAVFSAVLRANNFDPTTVVPLSSARRRRRPRL